MIETGKYWKYSVTRYGIIYHISLLENFVIKLKKLVYQMFFYKRLRFHQMNRDNHFIDKK